MIEHRPDWFPDWSGETAVLVASGPSAARVRVDRARGLAKTIAVNTSWKLAPWADVLFACDEAWWRQYGGVPAFSGIKICLEHRAQKISDDIRHVWCDKVGNRIDFGENGNIGWGGNSGFGAINLAVKFRAKRILLVGYDMHLIRGDHWHGSHPRPLSTPKEAHVNRWRRGIESAAKHLEAAGIEVINCSPVSALTSYPVMDLEEALSRNAA